MTGSATAIIVPFYNERARFGPELRARFAELAAHPSVDVVTVDDGSTDDTLELLNELAAASQVGKVEVLALSKNVGKGEAVRRGMLHALGRGRSVVGFADADFSTPPGELLALLGVLVERPGLDVVVGSRTLLVGRKIRRHAARHYLGRVFATLAANILRTPFYDTQCGAKLFRRTPTFESALAEPFVSRWAFDVELLGRLLIGNASHAGIAIEKMREVPLEEWIDAGGSKVTAAGMVRSLADLAHIEIVLQRRRRVSATRRC